MSEKGWDVVPLRAVAADGGLFVDGDWVESKDQDPNGEIRLTQLADVGDSFFLDKSNRWINSDKFRELRCTEVLPGDILIARMPDPIARSAILPEGLGCPVITVVDVAILRAGTGWNSRYVMWAINSSSFRNDVDSRVSGSTRQRISRSALGRTKLFRPPLETQQRIADYLDRETAEIDAAVADLDRYVELLEIRKKAKIGHAVLGGAEPGQRQLLNAVIGTIPSSWAVSKFSIEFSESNELNGDDVVGSLLSISEFYGVIVNRRGDEGQQSSEDVSHYRVVHPGQLAANMMWLDHGGLGVSALHGHISPDYRAFDISKRISPAYAHYLLRSKTYVDHFSTISVGVRPNAKRTTKVTLGMTPIPIPPLEVQVRIVADLDSEVAEIDDLIAESKKLRDLLLKRRSVLITEVVTGRKQV